MEDGIDVKNTNRRNRIKVFNKNRVENLTDAIFAFSMTLLVTTLAIPDATTFTSALQIDSVILQILPDIMNYFIAFVLIATFWYIHHLRFHYLRSIDSFLIIVNVILLSFVALMPFTAHLVASFPLSFSTQIIFELNLLVIGILTALQWEYMVCKPLHLTDPEDLPDIIANRTKTLVFPFLSVIGIGLAMIHVPRSAFVYLFVPLFIWIIDLRRKKEADKKIDRTNFMQRI